MQQQPALSSAFAIKLALRLRQMTFQRSLLSIPNIPQRVCCQLWALISEKEKVEVKSSQIINPPTHMEMAIMLNVSRETVTRVFQKLQGREIVRKNGTKKLEVLQVQLLGELAEGGIEL